MEERNFATISKESVKMIAESIGITNLQDDAAAELGEDANYRLREVVEKSTAYMKSAKRRRLCPEDLNQALRDMNVQPVFGHGSVTDAAPFRQTREGELHFIEESEVTFNNIVCNSYIPKHLGETSIKAQWMALEGVNKFSSSAHSAHLQHLSKNVRKESSAEILEYYNLVIKALMGQQPVLVKWVLKNLSENNRVQAALPYFVNFVANGVKVASDNVGKLTVLMKTVAALLKNKMVLLIMQSYLRLLVQAVETCLLEPLASCTNQQSVDHWMLRNLASGVLAGIIRKWSSPVNRLKMAVISKLSEIVQDVGRPMYAHYGAVMGLTALGCAEVEAVLVPHLPQLLEHLQASASSSGTNPPIIPSMQSDALRVLEAVQLAMEKLLRAYMDTEDLKGPSDSNTSGQRTTLAYRPSRDSAPVRGSGQEVLRLYKQLSESLGDTLGARLPILELDRVFRRQPSSELVSLGDSDSKRSGEELLADLMRQVQQEQEEQEQRKRALQQQQLLEQQSADLFSGVQDVNRELRELMAAAASSTQPQECVNLEQDMGFEDQLAISSTISDPSKGTLKLKIKRHPPGQGSPSIMRQLNKDTADSPQQGRDPSRDYRLNRKRKQQLGKSPWEQEFGDLEGLPDLEESLSHSLRGHTPHAYSPGGESSGSDTTMTKKRKLMLKLKVPSRDSPSD